ncbi:hypothetical protein PC39_07094 [Salinisphaera sp. PC39]|uniref:hypothetical protein n=1 Tax=Salinisphaera sp. PC39 TaxID=1304156 RepID=UPI003340459D
MFLILLCAALGLAVAILSAALWALWRRHRRLLQARDDLSRRDMVADFYLAVTVLNAERLARERSQVGRHMFPFAPRLVTRRVYEVVARELHIELRERGVEADIEVRGKRDGSGRRGDKKGRRSDPPA